MPAPDFAAEIAALEKGLASGEARIESDGDSVTYRSVADIKAALDYYRVRAAEALGLRHRIGGSTVARFDRDCG